MATAASPTDPQVWRLRQPLRPALERGAVAAVPVGLAILAELLLDSHLAGAVSTGALLTGFVAFEAPGRIRFFWQAICAPLVGVGAALGVVSTEPAAAAVLAMFLAATAGGFCVAVSLRLAIAAMMVVLALLIAQGQFIPIDDAPDALLLGTIGGLWQSLFALAAWALWDRGDEPFDLVAGIRGAGATFAANLTLRSQSFRHALRWGAALAFGVAIYRVLDLGAHGFWVPLTILFVLKPDPGQTVERILMRAAGTVGGLIAATALAEALVNDAVPVSIALAIAAAFSYALLATEYALFTAAITTYVVLLADVLGEPPLEAADQRGLGTVIGILVALLAIRAWPERGSAEQLIAEPIEGKSSAASAST
jgi:hypothetical protein